MGSFIKGALKVYVVLGVLMTIVFTLTMITFSGDSGSVRLSVVLIVGSLSLAIGSWAFVYVPVQLHRALSEFPSHLPLIATYVFAVPLVGPLATLIGIVELIVAALARRRTRGQLDPAARKYRRLHIFVNAGMLALVVGALTYGWIEKTVTTIWNGEPTLKHPFGTRLTIKYPNGRLRVPFEYLHSRYENYSGRDQVVFRWPDLSPGSVAPFGSTRGDPSLVMVMLNTTYVASRSPYVVDLEKLRASAQPIDTAESPFPGLRAERFLPRAETTFLSPSDPSMVDPSGAPWVFACHDGRVGGRGDRYECQLSLELDAGLGTDWWFGTQQLTNWQRFTRETIVLLESFKAPPDATR